MEKNKRIGLLTFHTPDNYGAVYQAFALQHYISEELAENIEIIDFCTPKHLKAYSIFKKKSNKQIPAPVGLFFLSDNCLFSKAIHISREKISAFVFYISANVCIFAKKLNT
jgi:hypothetical protein